MGLFKEVDNSVSSSRAQEVSPLNSEGSGPLERCLVSPRSRVGKKKAEQYSFPPPNNPPSAVLSLATWGGGGKRDD